MEASEGEVGQFGRTFINGLSAGDIQSAAFGRTDFASNAALLHALGELRPQVSGLYEERRQAYGLDPSEQNYRAMAEAGVLVSDLEQKMLNLRRAQGDVALGFKDFGASIDTSVINSFGDGLYRLVSRTGSWRDAMVGFAQDVQRAWSQMVAQTVVKQLLGSGFEGLFSGSWFGPAKVYGDVPNTPMPGNTVWTPAGYNGGVLGGRPAILGRVPVLSFERGGIYGRPTALVGDRRDGRPEAVVPLPDGRSIPVTMRGSGQQVAVAPAPNVYVLNFPSQEQAQAAASVISTQERDAIIKVVASNIHHGGEIAKTIRRSY
jgi:hypothetical protein